MVGWSYGGFVICDYLRAHGEGAVSAINFVGAAVNLNERFDDIGPAFLSNAPAGVRTRPTDQDRGPAPVLAEHER